MRVRRKLIRRETERLLSATNIAEPAVQVQKIAKYLKLIVRNVPGDAAGEISGFLLKDQSTGKAIIGVNQKHHPNRRRFTIAHEIGHSVLHPEDSVYVDRNYRAVFRDSRSSEGIDVREMEANLFAAELLMPEPFIVKDLEERGFLDLEDGEYINSLAAKFQVSRLALTNRLNSLGYL